MTQVEKARIAVAKAIMTARGLNPDTLYQHRDWEDWPTDAEQGSLNNQMQPTTIKLHYAWRKALPWADAAILVYEAAKAAPGRVADTHPATAIGKWLSAALEDPNVCAEMKADIRAWFDIGEPPLQQHWPAGARYLFGDLVQKKRGSKWRGRVNGFYVTKGTPIGYAVESSFEAGSTQVWPEDALEPWDGVAC